MRKLATVALCAALAASCASRPPEYIEVRPECTVPPQPALPTIKGEELQQGVPTADGGRRLEEGESYVADDVYWRLEESEKRLADWALEMEAALRELCRGEEKAGDVG